MVSFKINPENGLLIKSFYDDAQDKELIRMMPLLMFLCEVKDVRDVREWSDMFIEDQFIEFTDKNGNDKVIDKSEYLRQVINYIHISYFDDLIKDKKRKSFSLKKNENKEHEAPDPDPCLE